MNVHTHIAGVHIFTKLELATSNKKAVGLMAQLKEEPSNVETKSSKTIHGHQLCMMYTYVL